ncbi:MAG: YbhB/YbcL family Raf kinase inhibitor-like protein [Candidatus Marinimicrobia bacterium]|nr:YbhB/YbcL family Raf kinase inhibitor-like protein [Candidatus Neomarinimicrobiota bacterium]
MILSSEKFEKEQPIPSKYSCDGDDVNPPLQIAEVPRGTKSLALVVDDPDSPSGTWTHWTVWNIPPETTEIREDSVPVGAVEGITTFGKKGYGGPCPGSGVHRYFFKLFALDEVLDIPFNVDAKVLAEEIATHTIEKAELMGMYGRGGV